jgi:hypothetical protein
MSQWKRFRSENTANTSLYAFMPEMKSSSSADTRAPAILVLVPISTRAKTSTSFIRGGQDRDRSYDKDEQAVVVVVKRILTYREVAQCGSEPWNTHIRKEEEGVRAARGRVGVGVNPIIIIIIIIANMYLPTNAEWHMFPLSCLLCIVPQSMHTVLR